MKYHTKPPPTVAFFMENLNDDKRELTQLREEVSYYRSLLFSDFGIKNISILNALRVAVDLTQTGSGYEICRDVNMLEDLCKRLENENSALRSGLE